MDNTLTSFIKQAKNAHLSPKERLSLKRGFLSIVNKSLKATKRVKHFSGSRKLTTGKVTKR